MKLFIIRYVQKANTNKRAHTHTHTQTENTLVYTSYVSQNNHANKRIIYAAFEKHEVLNG